MIRGTVLGRDGGGVGGVSVTILNHPEFGSTLTRADGRFDMAVNGGRQLTVNYQKDGYLAAQRQVQVPWRDYVWTDDLVLVPFDTSINAVAFGASVTQVERGSTVTDADGTRQATILFPPGTQASMVMADGTTQPLASMHVRATEYTVGPEGPKAMPAVLPQTSGYTYAVELSVDEAVMAGATRVQFNQPTAFYVENFLGFPVGGIVPTGYYDRQVGTWIPSDNGRIVKVIRITGGLADLDTNGDGLADSGSALGISTEERAQLAVLYSPGTTLWRIPITHFSPWDCNWPYGCTDQNHDGKPDCEPPRQPPPDPPTPLPQPCEQNGSRIECQNQVLGERADVAGAPFSLNYTSARATGRTAERTLRIPISGSTVPFALQGIEAEIVVAGQRHLYRFSPTPNQSLTVEWDGLDAYGRPHAGTARVKVRIGYVYRSEYLQPSQMWRSFAALSASGVALSTTRVSNVPVVINQYWEGALEAWTQPGPVDGWFASIHHVFDPETNTLLLGDGTRQAATAATKWIARTVAGGGRRTDDGAPATSAAVGPSWGNIASAPDGTLYFLDGYGVVRRIDPAGFIWRFAGTEGFAPGYSGDGGPALLAKFNYPRALAVAPDGGVLVADRLNQRIRKIGTDGIIRTIAGTGVAGFSGDGGPATEAQISNPMSLAVAADGTVYVADEYNDRIRAISPDGIITTFAGTGGWAPYNAPLDGQLATKTAIPRPSGLSLDGLGNVIAAVDGGRIVRISGDGRIRMIAGTADYLAPGPEDGAAALGVHFWGSQFSTGVARDGSVLISSDSMSKVWRVSPDGLISTVTGGMNFWGGPWVEGSLATAVGYVQIGGIGVGPDGDLYVGDLLHSRIVRITSGMPQLSLDGSVVPSRDGRELYVFSGRRHQRTLDALTGAVRFSFSYDGAGRLVRVDDGDANATLIERDSAGRATAIVAPNGQRTVLRFDDRGWLSEIQDPAGSRLTLEQDAGGLLQILTDPRGHAHHFSYDAGGRLIRDENPAGGVKTLQRIDGDRSYAVTVATALGRTTRYAVTNLATGTQRRSTVSPDGTVSTQEDATSGTTTTVTPDGTVATSTIAPDPRLGMGAPTTSTTVGTPGGKLMSVAEVRSATLSDPFNPFSATSLGERFTVNGRAYVSTYDTATRTWTSNTPAGRTTTSTLDAKGRLAQLQPPGVQAIAFGYDSKGRPHTVTQGSRVTVIDYDSAGQPWRITDPIGRQVELYYDGAGRLASQVLPGSRVVGFGHDASGNVTSVTPPGRPAHGFTYTPVDLLESYTPPTVAGLGLDQSWYSYDVDGALTQLLFPDHSAIVPGYDPAGRLASVTTSHGTTVLGYDGQGRVQTMTTPDGNIQTFGYDGFLPTSETRAGAVAGTVGWAYDNDFRLSSLSVNGAAVSFQYDPDSLLTQAGALTIAREPTTGRISGTTLGTVTTSQSYDGYRALASFSASVGGVSRYSYTLTPDGAGRIVGKTETVLGQTHQYDYGYDDAGRLWTVKIDGALATTYQYDDNGNRLQKTSGAGTETGVPDDQDRLVSYGGATYTYRPNGDLESKTVQGQTTWYSYDGQGNLLAASKPDGTYIEYVVDGLSRRVGKKVNGALVEGFLYEGQLRPVAWLDGSGNVYARFVYGLHANVPEYMVTASGTFRFVTDYLGSPRLVVNTSTGAVAQRIDYDEWGQVLQDTNPGAQPFGFAGGLYDRDTGLVRFGARDYDPQTGRWTNKDPVRFRGGLNLYQYCFGDPINMKDPGGLLAGGDDAVAAWLANAAIESGMLGGAGGLGAGTALSWAGGAGLAFGGGWLAGTWLNGYLEPYIQNGLDAVFGPPGGYQAVKPDIKQINDIARIYHLSEEEREDFGDWLEKEKACGRGGTKNQRGDFKWKELEEKIREFLGLE